MASASLLKTSPVINKTDFIKGQALRQPSVSVNVVRSHPSGLTVRASSYADELVKTAVCTYILTCCSTYSLLNMFCLMLSFYYYSYQIIKHAMVTCTSKWQTTYFTTKRKGFSLCESLRNLCYRT